MYALGEKFFNTVANGGAWPIVVLVAAILLAVLCLIAVILATFVVVQRGRKKATLKLWIATFDLTGEIQERPRRGKSAA